jgi:MFS transporter, Spinster family, sphingosine-1-phosphate transporter
VQKETFTSNVSTSSERELNARTRPAAQSIRILIVVLVVTLGLSLVTTPLNQVADPVRRSLSIDDVQFSFLLGALFAIPSIIMTVVGGWLADRVSRRLLLASAMLFWTGGAVWSAFATTYSELAIARLIVAAAAGIKFPVVMTWVSDAYPPERRGKAIGAVFVVIGIAPAIGATLSGLVLHASQQITLHSLPGLGVLEPWRLTVATLALLNFLVLPWIFGLPDLRRGADEIATAGTVTTQTQTPSVWLLAAIVLATALVTLADNANLAWLPTVLSRQFTFDAREVGFIFGLIVLLAGSLGPIIGGWLDGRIYRRHGPSGRLAACSGASLICAPLLGAFMSNNAQLLTGSLIISGTLTMLITTISFVALQGLLPPAHRGVGIGITQALNNLAAASAPTLVALVSAGLNAGAASLSHAVSLVTVTTFLATSLVCAACATALSRSNRFAESINPRVVGPEVE